MTTDRTRSGIIMGASCYLLWGVFPLYFNALKPAGGLEILVHRIAWSALTCAVLLTLTRTWRPLGNLARSKRTLALMSVAAILIATNWLIYVIAVTTGHVVEAALGYYINPLLTVLLGVLVLSEKLRRLQWVAIGFAVAAVLVITIGFGRPPWVSLILASTFAAYSLVKNRVGRSVGALHSLTVETWLLLLPALVVLVFLQVTGVATFGSEGISHAGLMASSGIATTIPLLLFAGAAARIPLSLVGLLQYLTPTAQLLIGVLILGESMTPARWIGFALIWTALTVLSIDSVQAGRQARRRRDSDPVEPL